MATPAPTSFSGSPTRPSGIWRENPSPISGSASMAAVIAGEYAIGETTFTVTPAGPPSRARPLANPRSAPFIIEYSGSVALPCMPAVEGHHHQCPAACAERFERGLCAVVRAAQGYRDVLFPRCLVDRRKLVWLT